MVETLSRFIAIPTLAHDRAHNLRGIDFVSGLLTPLGFRVELQGDSPFHQPVVVARYTTSLTSRKVVLYGHYDVERIKEDENWDTPPFVLTPQNGRLYGRGVADNKGTLLARILALKAMVDAGESLPNILWIIQGEEEVAGPTPFEVIPRLFREFGSALYLEETGVHSREGQPVLFLLPKTATPPAFLEDLNQAVFDGGARVERRCLHKFSRCPFITNIPGNGFYLGFGPNDPFARIHAANESVDQQLLLGHGAVFQRFIRWVVESPLVPCAE